MAATFSIVGQPQPSHAPGTVRDLRPEILFPLFAPVTSLPGIGPRLGKLVERLAGPAAIDLLWHLPNGIIDRGFRPGDIQPQVREVEIVKRTQHGVIADPYSVSPSASLDEAAALMTRSRVGTLVILDDHRRLKGLLTERDLRFVNRSGQCVADRMTPLERLVVHTGRLAPA